MSSRYEPRRRARTAPPGRTRTGTHRQARQRRRAGLFAFALALTVLVGVAGIGLTPEREVAVQAAALDAASSSFENTELAIVEKPRPKPVKKPAAEALAAKVAAGAAALPKDSGSGKRVVFSKSEQRVWLVDADGTVERTYKVSGSIHDNLAAGTYAVQSHTRHATAYDYASHMEYFVGFATGKNAPIGFHDIPVSNGGALLQTLDQLGTPLSSGCIRQSRPDAIRLWEFAPVGTAVIVLA